MQKKLYLNLMLTVVLIGSLWGCAGLQPAFNPNYLSSTAPEAPSSRIEMTPEVVDTIAEASKQYPKANAGIDWIASDNLIVRVGVIEKRGHFATFLIIPSSKQIRKLEGAEEELVLKKLDERVDIETTESKIAKVLGTINLLAGGLGGKGKKITPFAGKIKDGTHTVDLKLKVETRGYSSCTIEGSIKNSSNDIRIPVRWNSYSGDYGRKGSMVHLLRDFRISPDGRYYLMDAAYVGGPYLYDSHMKRKCKPDWLMKYYEHHALTVDPAWKHIALLRSEKSAMQKDNRYWIEIHDISITGM